MAPPEALVAVLLFIWLPTIVIVHTSRTSTAPPVLAAFQEIFELVAVNEPPPASASAPPEPVVPPESSAELLDRLLASRDSAAPASM